MLLVANTVNVLFHQRLIVMSPMSVDVRVGRTATHVPFEIINGFAGSKVASMGTIDSVAGYSGFRGRRFA
jgi:hypothetical protein